MRRLLVVLTLLAACAAPTAPEVVPFHPARVVLIGDSITAHLTPTADWFGPAAADWRNTAISGSTLFAAIDRFDRDVPAGTQFTVILLGVNDASIGYPPATIADNFRWLVESSRAKGATPILGTILPVATTYTVSDPAVLNAKIRPLNEWLRWYAETNHIALIDYAAAFTGPDGFGTAALMVDGLHPTLAGDSLMIRTAHPVLVQAGALP